MDQFMSSSSLKSAAKGQLLGKYGVTSVITLLIGLCLLPVSMIISLAIGTSSVISVFLYSAAQLLLQILFGFFLAGEAYVYLTVASGASPAVKDLFRCFGEDASKVAYVQAVAGGISILCSLPAMILGIFALRSLPQLTEESLASEEVSGDAVLFLIYAIVYLAGSIVSLFVDLMLSQRFYLMMDFPEYSASQLLKMSISIMKGNKGRLFYIALSFIPMYLLCFLSCGIAFLWVRPYMQATYANFYLDLVRKRKG